MLKINGIDSVYLPGLTGEKADKLMVVLHGLGDSAEGYRFLPQFLGSDRFDYLLLNAPDKYFTGFSWFDIYENPEPGILRSRKLLFSLVDQLFAQGYSGRELCFLGFSQGALMVLDLACRFPCAFAGFVGISGYVYGVEEYPAAFSAFAKEQKIFVSHGDVDPVIPISMTRKQVEQLQEFGLPIEWREYNKEHTIDPVSEKQDIVKFLSTL